MKASLLVLPRAEADMQDLHPRDFVRVVETMEFLCAFPLACQKAALENAPEVRRAVAGNYLIYYRFDSREHDEIHLMETKSPLVSRLLVETVGIEPTSAKI